MAINSFGALTEITIDNQKYSFFDIAKITEKFNIDVNILPFSIRILLENIVRHEDGTNISKEHIEKFINWTEHKGLERMEVLIKPVRILMQDLTGVPAIVDLSAMRDATIALNGDVEKINPIIPVHLVVDHSVQAVHYGDKNAINKNIELEMQYNIERYELLKWAQNTFTNLSIIPPGNGICHQINIEHIAPVVHKDSKNLLCPDMVFGTDSHTTMVNALGVLGWGVGGIEAEAAMLGQFITVLQPQVIGCKINGRPNPGINATDIVLYITKVLRKYGVVGKFVEFFGKGLEYLSLPDRATISNMAPEYGSTCGFFPIDNKTLEYLHLTGREKSHITMVEEYAKKAHLWKIDTDPTYTDTIEINLNEIHASIAGPKRPQDLIILKDAPKSFEDLKSELNHQTTNVDESMNKLTDGSIVIGAITSCTNTSNPNVMVAAGLIAKNAIERGLSVPSFVKTSLSPGSKVVTEYLNESGLSEYLDKLGFYNVGYGCMTCIGNSGPLKPEIEQTIKSQKLIVASVLSGNRNFEGRIHNLVKANYLASPPLVIAYSLLGNIRKNILTTSLSHDINNNVTLSDIWPDDRLVSDIVNKYLTVKTFIMKYKDIKKGDDIWSSIKIASNPTFQWKQDSTYIEKPTYFDDCNAKETKFKARCLLLLGNSITTDHISPAGNIHPDSAAAIYLRQKNIQNSDLHSYGARRGNGSVMMRGTFANTRIRNAIVQEEGPYTKHFPTGEIMSIYDASVKYRQTNTPLIVIGGSDYGSGSSRDWAAKGPYLLGVRGIIAESFERIHRSNLVGMGIMPMLFMDNTQHTLKLTGDEIFDIDLGVVDNSIIRRIVECKIIRSDGSNHTIKLQCCIDTISEVLYYQNNGILQYSLKTILDN